MKYNFLNYKDNKWINNLPNKAQTHKKAKQIKKITLINTLQSSSPKRINLSIILERIDIINMILCGLLLRKFMVLIFLSI